MPPKMTLDGRERFLASARVGVVSVPDDVGRAPLTVPIWYSYEPGGEVNVITRRDSRKADLMRKTDRITLCVQAPEPPYRYVVVEGPITAIHESVTAEERTAMACRYLGADEGERFVEATAFATPVMIRVTMRPEHWLTQDQTGWP